MGSKIAELLEADKIVSRGEEGFQGVITRAAEGGGRGAEAIRLLNQFGRALTEVGKRTAEFAGESRVEDLGKAFERADDAAQVEALASKIEEYRSLISSKKLEAVESKISGLDVTAIEELSNNEAFIDAFIDSGGKETQVEFSTLNSSNLFGDLNGEGFAKELNKPESGLGQFIGKEDAAERITEFKNKYPNGIDGETKYDKTIKDIFIDKNGKYGDAYKDNKIMNKLKEFTETAERDKLASTMENITNKEEMDQFLKRIGKGDKIEDAARYAKENKKWPKYLKNLVGRNKKISALIGGVILGGGLAGLYELYKDDPKCDKSKAHCKDNCCEVGDALVGDFKDGAANSDDCEDCKINNSDVGGVCANRRKFIENEQPPSPIKDDDDNFSFTYDTLDIEKWPKDCKQENENQCWMDKNFQIYKGALTDTNYKYPTDKNKNWRWPSYALKLKDCKSCMGEIKNYTDMANIYSHIDCESSNFIDDIISTILGWITCGEKVFWGIISFIGLMFLLGLVKSAGKILLYLLPFLLWFGYTLYCIIPIIYNFSDIFNGKCTDEPVEDNDKKTLTQTLEGILDGSDDRGEKISKGRGGLVFSYAFFWPMIVVQICIFIGLFRSKKTDGKKPNEDNIEQVMDPIASEIQGGGSRENKAFDVIKNINRYTKGLIILSLIVAILITYFYKKNKGNTIKKQYLNEIKKERSSRIENIKQMREKEKRDKEERDKQEAKQEANQGPFVSNNIFGGQFI